MPINMVVAVPLTYQYNDPTQHWTYNNDTDIYQYRMIVKTSDNKIVMGMPIAPRDINYDGWGRVWSEVPRDGQTSYLVYEGWKLPKISFTAIFGRQRDDYYDFTNYLKTIRDLSNTTVPLKITYGGYFESNYSWRLTNWSFKSVYRHPNTNAITRAEVDFEFTMAKDVVLKTGPVSGGK